MFPTIDYRHDFSSLLKEENEKLCDFIFVSQQEDNIPCHRSVLGSLSKVFTKMWSCYEDPFSNDIRSRYNINRNTYTVKLFVNALYGKPGMWSIEDALVLLEMAAQFEIEGLKDNCTSFLIRHLSSSNCVKLAVAADKYNCPELLHLAVRDIYSNGQKKASQSPYWNDIMFGLYSKVTTEMINFGFRRDNDDWSDN